MRQASQRLAAGELDVRVPDPGPGGDEISALGRDFNTMADRLQQLLDSRNQLLSDVSHELRYPLARLQVALELARRKTGDEIGDSLDRMERDIRRLDELIGEVLRLARLERGGAALQASPLDLAEVLLPSCEDAAFEAEHTGRRVRWGAFPRLLISGDPSLLRSALDNVLRNAIRSSPADGEVVVEAVAAGGFARITVSDRGTGVPEDQLARIFEPFVRVSSARDRESGGYGLGLAIVRRAVEAHGGSVRAENAEPHGLRVTISLPLSKK
ncbi:MAG: HAMP domain-containing protein [Ectothiorhodospiraceae bacterium]|nr:HAMP domain-containing protein [Ectothiorhodospiraceae bacterium]